MDREFCIFCKSQLDQSDEHIIPQSVNGTLHSKKLICYDCNSNFFGRLIDPIIKELLNPLLIVLNFKNANSLQGEDINGEKYIISKGFKSRPLRPIKEKRKFGKGTLITIKGDPKNSIKMLKKDIKRFKEQGKVLSHLSITELKDSSPFISAKWEISISPELILLMNKIAVEFYIFNNLDYSVIESLCKRIRKFDKKLFNVIFCNQRNEIRDFNDDEISHLILIRNDTITGHLYAYIEIFNLICCTVILAEEYRGKDVSLQYYQDALTGERFTKSVELKMSIKDILSQKFVSDNFQYLNNSLADRLRTRDFNSVLSQQLNLLMDDLKEKEKNGEITKENLGKEYIEKSTQLVATLTVYHFPYILEDNNDEDNDDYNYIHSNFRKEVVEEFCKEQSQFLGKKIKTKEGIFTITGFHKQPHIVKRDKELITLFFILVKDQDDIKKYIKVKTIIDAFIDEMERHRSGQSDVN